VWAGDDFDPPIVPLPGWQNPDPSSSGGSTGDSNSIPEIPAPPTIPNNEFFFISAAAISAITLWYIQDRWHQNYKNWRWNSLFPPKNEEEEGEGYAWWDPRGWIGAITGAGKALYGAIIGAINDPIGTIEAVAKAIALWILDVDCDGKISKWDIILALPSAIIPPFQLIRVWHITGKVEILTEEGCGDNKILLGILYFFDNEFR